MKLKITQDADIGVEHVFAVFSDFGHYETVLAENSVWLTRKDGWDVPQTGVQWVGKSDLQGKTRRVEAELSDYTQDRSLRIVARIGGLKLEHEVTLVPLGMSLTRINMVTDLRPETLKARLLVQGLKLKRGQVLNRMQARLGREVARIERKFSPAG